MNIRVNLTTPIRDGTEVLFRSPVDCSQVTGLIVYYKENGSTLSKEFAFADAHGNNVGDIDHLFAENVVVKVILDVTHAMAFVQNADTNAYLEGRFAEMLPKAELATAVNDALEEAKASGAFKGDKGDTGPQGPQGEKGATGATGPQGAKGDTGATGPQGPQGPAGSNGAKGDKGDTGAQGPKGDKGDTGATGPAGPAGADGAKGDPGADGPAGADGITPEFSIGTVTTLGAGSNAFATITGSKEKPVLNLGIPKGADGAGGGGSGGGTGADGEDGGYYIPALNGAGDLSWNPTKADMPPVQTVNIKGPQGDKGDKGDRGEQGIQGIQGEPGTKGDKGDKGDTGATGASGYSPVRGTDYWTASDIAEIKSYVDDAILGGAW